MPQFDDIPYNFLIGGDGAIYEGRGFFRSGEIIRTDNVNEFDVNGAFVAFIGNFDSRVPSPSEVAALTRLTSVFRNFDYPFFFSVEQLIWPKSYGDSWISYESWLQDLPYHRLFYKESKSIYPT